MKTKEEYVKFVKEWKITHEALVKLQLYVKKYLIKTEYPNKKFKLSDEDLKRYLVRLTEVYNPQNSPYHWTWPSDDRLERWSKSARSAGAFKWILREKLHEMYDVRSLEKEQFKNSILESAEV